MLSEQLAHKCCELGVISPSRPFRYEVLDTIFDYTRDQDSYIASEIRT